MHGHLNNRHGIDEIIKGQYYYTSTNFDFNNNQVGKKIQPKSPTFQNFDTLHPRDNKGPNVVRSNSPMKVLSRFNSLRGSMIGANRNNTKSQMKLWNDQEQKLGRGSKKMTLNQLNVKALDFQNIRNNNSKMKNALANA